MEIEEIKKIAVLTAAGYSEREIRELQEDGFDFDERVWLIEHGHPRREIEKIGAEKLMKRAVKEMAEISLDAQETGNRSD